MNDSSKLHLILVTDPAEESWAHPQTQEAFQAIHGRLEEADAQVFAITYMTRDASSVSKLMGEFVLPLAGLFGPLVAGVLVSWITGRAGRKLKLKIGDVELEANSPAEIANLLKQVADFKAQLSQSEKNP